MVSTADKLRKRIRATNGRDQLMRAREDADGVQLDGPKPPEHRCYAALPGVGADESLRAEGDNARFVLAQSELRRWQRGTGHDRRLPGAGDTSPI